MKKIFCVLALSAALLPIDSMAWGPDGHSTVGAIADQLIKGTHAEKQVAALLLPGESLEKVANWMDCVKGNYCGPQTPEMLEYTTANPQHMEYHYTDIPFQNPRYRDGEVGSTDHDIVQSLKQAISVLQGKDDASSNPHHFTKRQALLLIAHLAGDIQQPLHVGASYIGASGGFVVPEQTSQIDEVSIFNTRGGNDLMLDVAALNTAAASLIPPKSVDADPAKAAADAAHAAAQPPTLPFHTYWDFTVVDYAMRRAGVSTPEQFAQTIISGKAVVAGNTGDPASWPYQWADDTLQVAKAAHAGVVPGKVSEQVSRKGEKYKVWALALPQDYPLTSSTLAKTQLIKGGYRLAALLEAIWP